MPDLLPHPAALRRSPGLDPDRARGWLVDPSITFVNHGSYGVIRQEVLDARLHYLRLIEADPPKFFKFHLERLMDRTREALGAFCNVRAQDLTPMPNATFGLSTVLHSYEWEPGDEVLITDHEYQSGFNELTKLARRTGLRIVEARVHLPIVSPEQVIDQVLSRITERTRLMVVSHIASASSIILPVHEIVAAARERGIDTIVDGAHTPGQIPVDIASIAPTFYVASLHKWLCAPKGTGFLYAHPERQAQVSALAQSCRTHNRRADRTAYLADFDYVGTNDYSTLAVVPETIEIMNGLVPGGWGAIMRHNHALVVEATRLITGALGTPFPAPPMMLGSMASVIVPEPEPGLPPRPCTYDDPLQDVLREGYGIQVPIWPMRTTGLRLMRLSAQLYNRVEDYQYLAQVLPEIIATEHPSRARRAS